ncbi:MAG: glycoside hydrolase family 3 protein [Ruminococcaceae bacterium]|nr:glycoside hydrolase family 3 protein [Oscillospiraceae bacterium]
MKAVSYILALISLGMALFGAGAPEKSDAVTPELEQRVEQIMDSMSAEQKIAQMIMPAIRTWEDGGVTDLTTVPELAGALRRHQYGGVILFSSNISGTEQTVRLVSALQTNNALGAEAKDTAAVPYLVAADQEGGSVARLTMGTRGTGSMAIGATGGRAEENALATGRVFGEELSALGINVNLGPCVDVIADLTDPGMSTRVFSDDPAAVSRLALAFARGVGESGVVTTYKHFPGVGDGSDYPTAIRLTSDELAQGGLFACRAVIDGGAEMVMTSATTFPLIDEKHFMADGTTEGYYPATLSPLFVTKLLREAMGFDGVVVTDALEMEQFATEPDNGKALFRGANGTVAHDLQVAEKAINAGCDLLLIPTDLCRSEAVRYYDEYIAGLAALVEGGSIDARRVDASVRRILTLKAKHGLLDLDTSGADVEERIAAALRTVGSAEHHAIESAIARQAVTLLKDDGVLPLSGGRIVIVGRTGLDSKPIEYALEQLMREGWIDAGARIENRISGEVRGRKGAAVTIVIDRYYDTGGGRLMYSDALSAAIRDTDAVVCLSAVGAGIDKLQDSNPAMRGVRRALSDAHAAGASFVLLSDNLPVDAARFQDADAIVCAYLSAGFGIDPTARTSGSENVGAFNANVPAALAAIFGAADMPGRLPIRIPVLEKGPDGSWSYGGGTLYECGFSAASGGR